MNIDRQQIWMSSKDYIIIALGIAIYAFGFCAFILPYKVVIGGLAGLGTIVYFTTGIPVAIAQFAMNMTLLAIAFKTVGNVCNTYHLWCSLHIVIHWYIAAFFP